MTDEDEMRGIATDAFNGFLEAFDIKIIEFHGEKAYKFETNKLELMMASLTQCHDKLYRVLLAIHITAITEDKRMDAVSELREFVDSYLDRSTGKAIGMLKNKSGLGMALGIVK